MSCRSVRQEPAFSRLPRDSGRSDSSAGFKREVAVARPRSRAGRASPWGPPSWTVSGRGEGVGVGTASCPELRSNGNSADVTVGKVQCPCGFEEHMWLGLVWNIQHKCEEQTFTDKFQVLVEGFM